MKKQIVLIGVVLIQNFSLISFSQNWDNYGGRLHPDRTFHSLDGRLKNNKIINKTKIRLKSKDTQIKENKVVKEIKTPGVNKIQPSVHQATPPNAIPKKTTQNNRWVNGVVSIVLLCLIIFVISRMKPVRSYIASFRGCPIRLKIAIALLIALIITGCCLIIFNPKL